MQRINLKKMCYHSLRFSAMEQTNYPAPLRPEFQLKHIYYYPEHQGGDNFNFGFGWALLFSFRRSKTLCRFTYTGLPNDRRYICYLDRRVFVTNTTWALNVYGPAHAANDTAFGYTPYPSRPIARNIHLYFPTSEECLQELQNLFREAIGDPNADILSYQNSGGCFLWPGTDQYSSYVLLPINGVMFNLSHLLLWAIEGIQLHDKDENGEFVHHPGRDRSDIDASHTCHRKSCIIANQIKLETQAVNNSRNTCIHAPHCLCGNLPACVRGPYKTLPKSETKATNDSSDVGKAKRQRFKEIKKLDEDLREEFPLYTPPCYYETPIYRHTNGYNIPDALKNYYLKDLKRWGINCELISKNGNSRPADNGPTTLLQTSMFQQNNTNQSQLAVDLTMIDAEPTNNCESISKNRKRKRKQKWTCLTPENFHSTAQRTSTLTLLQQNVNYFTTTVDSDNGPTTKVRTSLLLQNNANQPQLAVDDDVPTQQLTEQQQDDMTQFY